jgi:hypothetical protein
LRFAETIYWLIYCDLEESTKLKQYLTSDLSIKFVVEPFFKIDYEVSTMFSKEIKITEFPIRYLAKSFDLMDLLSNTNLFVN